MNKFKLENHPTFFLLSLNKRYNNSMSLHTRLLLEPSLAELSPHEQAWVREAKERCEKDTWYKTANYAPSVHPRFKGFCLSRTRHQAFPVYETDNGLVAVNYQPKEHSVESWAIEEYEVFPDTLNFLLTEDEVR